MFISSLMLLGCIEGPLGPVGPEGDPGPPGEEGEDGKNGRVVTSKSYDLEDQLTVYGTEIYGEDQDNPLGVRRVRCPDSHPILLHGGCNVDFHIGITRNISIPESEDGNAGWECVPAEPPPAYFIVLVTAQATCIHD